MTVKKLQAYSPRDMFAKVAKMISRKGVKVEFRGNQPRVETCVRTGKVIRMVLPELPDTASDDLMEAMHGFLDHECAHILYTAFKQGSDWARIEPTKKNRRSMMANIVEDIRIERKLPDDLPGTKRNLERMYETFIPKYIDPATKNAIAQGTPSAKFAGVLVPAMRALSGQKQFQRYMDDNDYWQHFEPMIMSYPELEADLKSMETYDDVLAISDRILEVMDPDEDEPEDEDDGDDQGGSPDDSEDEGESDDSQQGDSDDAADDDADESEDPETSEDSGDDEADEDEKESDDGEGHGDGEGTDDEEDEDSGDCSGDEDESNPDEDEGDGQDDSDTGDGDSEGEDEDDSESEGASDSNDDGEDEGDSDGSDSEDGDAEDEDDGEPEDEGETGGSSDEDSGERPKFAIDVSDSDLEDHAPDMDAMFEDIIGDEMGSQSHSSWRPWTREYDELYEWDVPTSTDCAPIDHHVAKTTGPMMKEIRRLIAAKSQVRRMPGMRSGRLHGPNLHRLLAGDDRLFTRREEAQSLDTAITLLIDASGSMSGSRYPLAIQSAYALASVLGKIGIAFECLAFTDNTQHPEYSKIADEVVEEFTKNPGDRTTYRTAPLVMPVFKTFDETWRGNVQRRFAWVHNTGGQEPAKDCKWGFTPEGDANEFAARRLLKRNEQRKILITMTDGQPGTPSASGGVSRRFGGGSEVKDFSRNMVKRIEAAGIDLIGVGIQSDSPQAYYTNSIVVNKVEELPQKMMGVLKKLIVNK